MTEQENNKPILFLMVGLPGSGKTMKAKEIESQHSALRLSPDEWILSLYGNDLDRVKRDAVREPIEALQWKLAQRVLTLGTNVVLDWGFWSRQERTTYRQEAATLGASSRVIFVDATLDELWKRISSRVESQKGTLHITREELEEWSKLFEAPQEDELTQI
jgi:predicted kinase